MTHNNYFHIILFLLFCVAALPAVAEPPSLPKTGISVDDFVPPGWFIREKAEGDLNGDAISDMALVLAPNAEKTADDASGVSDRFLLLLFKDSGGLYSFSAAKDGFILCKSCGGMMGDPLQPLVVHRGAVSVEIYGGSRNRWGTTYKFRWQKGNWYLIGTTDVTADTLELTSHTVDVNWNTGDIEIKNAIQDKETVKKLKKQLPLLTLTDFTPEKATKLVGVE